MPELPEVGDGVFYCLLTSAMCLTGGFIVHRCLLSIAGFAVGPLEQFQFTNNNIHCCFQELWSIRTSCLLTIMVNHSEELHQTVL